MLKINYSPLTLSYADIIDENRFVVPQFQRNVVWKPDRRKDFIDNIKAGDPFGMLLLHLMPDGKYSIIDGLQRITTLRDYNKDKFKYCDCSAIDESSVIDLVKQFLQFQGIPESEPFIMSKTNEIQNYIFEQLKNKEEIYDIIDSTIHTCGLIVPKSEDLKIIKSKINKICTDFNDATDISNLSIIAVNYTGEIENIPRVFYNLNTGAVTLSKYETYAALWSKPLYVVDDKEILDAVKEKYITIQNDSELDVDFDETVLETKGITLFEYCYALSRILRGNKKTPNYSIFTKNGKSTDPMGFELLSLVLGKNVNEAYDLHKLLENVKPEFLIALKDCLTTSVKYIDSVMSEYLTSLGGARILSDNNYMIYHIVVAYIKEYYEIDLVQQTVTIRKKPLSKENFKKYLPYHYLHDCMTNYWKENRQVSDLAKNILDDSLRTKYWYSISNNEWNDVVSEWMEGQLIGTYSLDKNNTAKLFIHYLTLLKFKEAPEAKNWFLSKTLSSENLKVDFEHIAIQETIKNAISVLPIHEQQLFPMSAVGDICYLTAKVNRGKKHYTLYEYVDDRAGYVTDDNFIDFIIYPSKDELSFRSASPDEFIKQYKKFIINRQDKLATEFCTLVKKYCI